ncbi:MAG: phosphoribosyltransferase [Zoogloeaceae bacterium]|jgi:hypothetical protein|nr:phosphoribosyltransferase [Zoogloeaceae bacterium]
MQKLFEVIKVLDVEPFQADNSEPFRFRLEIRRELGTDAYEGRVYRLETYRLQVTFPQSNGVLPDFVNNSMVYVVDDMIDGNALTGNSVHEVIEKFRRAFRHFFPTNIRAYPEGVFDA